MSALTVIADGEDHPGSLAIDDRYIYWSSSKGLRRANLDGSDITTLTSDVYHRIAAAEGGVFGTSTLANKVYRVDRESGKSEVIGSGEYPDGIAVHNKHVYWTNGAMEFGTGTLARTSVDGKDTTILADKLSQPSGVAANSDFVYFSSGSMSCQGSTPPSTAPRSSCIGGGITRISLRDSSVETIDSQSTALDVVLNERGAYWLINPGIIKFAGVGAHEARDLAATGDGEGPIAVDANAFYLGSSNRGRVLKVSLDGGEPKPIVTDLGGIGGMAVDGDWVYVAANSGRILRVSKDGRAAQPSAPVTGPCTMPPTAAEDVAATPRADVNLELLALSLDPGRITADEETYQRVVADVEAIRKADPSLAKISYFAHSDGRQLLITPNDLTMESIRAGEYSAWDCLNDFYGLQDLFVGSTYVVVTLKGTYDILELSKLYKALPGIRSASSNLGGDGPTICAGRNGSTYEYVVDKAAGDCPAGCITHEAHAFISTASGEIESRGVWNSETGEGDATLYNKLCR